MYNTFKFAFTLAEVLITLVIIGIIAAMTLPALINKTKNTENLVALKKDYETLSQAYYIFYSENGVIQNALGSLTSDTDYEGFANVFIPKLNVAKNCGIKEANASGCFPDKIYTYLDGTTTWKNFLLANNHSLILTNDGMSYAFVLFSATCSSQYSTDPSSPLYNTCGQVHVDINGPNKGPAIAGRDTFSFYITKKGVYPRGSYPDYTATSDCQIYGLGCAGQVLLNGSINY